MTSKHFIFGLIATLSIGVGMAFFWPGRDTSSIDREVGTDWKTYRDDTFGYAVAVPETWVKYQYPVTPEPGLMNFFSRPGLAAPLEMSEDDLSLTIMVRRRKAGEDVETIAGRTQRNLDGLPEGIQNIVIESTRTTVNDRDAIIQREEVPSNADSESGALKVLYVTDGENIYILSVLGTNENVIFKNDALINDIFTRLQLPPKNANSATTTYSNEELGISFQYAREDLGERILVDEVDSTIYVYPEGTPREDGQYVRVFTKDPNATLQQAIQQNFLKGYNQADCFVTKGTDSKGTKPARGIAAVIAYPVPDEPIDEWLKNAEKCPKDYGVTNGISYFWTDAENSDRYVFFSIGQYYIPADVIGTSWHDTLELLK